MERLPNVPGHLMAAGALVWDGAGRLLLVKASYRGDPTLPGGLVEADESPAEAATREVAEETGLQIALGALLVVQRLAATESAPASLQWVFDSAALDASPQLVLPPEEIESADWVDPNDAVRRVGQRGRARLSAALAVHRTGGGAAYLEGDRLHRARSARDERLD